MEPKGSLLCSQEPAKSSTLCNVLYHADLYSKELLPFYPTPRLEDHRVLVYAATCSLCSQLYLEATSSICNVRLAVLWWQGAHLTWTGSLHW
jgi:hypothetical protein